MHVVYCNNDLGCCSMQKIPYRPALVHMRRMYLQIYVHVYVSVCICVYHAMYTLFVYVHMYVSRCVYVYARIMYVCTYVYVRDLCIKNHFYNNLATSVCQYVSDL